MCSRLARQPVWKGQLAVYKRSSCAQAGVRHHVGELAVRKKRRLLARCFQYKRLLSRSLASILSAVQAMELAALKRQLSKVFGDNLSLRHVLEHIATIQGDLRRLEESARAANITRWRRQMVSAGAELSRWLKNRSTPVGVSVINLHGCLAESDVEAAEAVHGYWVDFWNQARERQPSLSDRVASMLAGLPSSAACSWEPPTAQCLRAIAVDGKGSHGPDGWVSREVALLPFEIFKVFAVLGKRWMLSGNVPAQFFESRMISLAKPGKVNALNQISVKHLRPITVMSVWWRIWASAWAKGCLREWMRQHVPRHFAVAHAVSTGEVVVDLLDKLMAGGYLASLDYSKAYDLLDPSVTKALMIHLGWDPSFVEVATKVWLHQERWVSFGVHTHVTRTPVAPAMPQGDPLGPLVMALWTWGGWASVESVCNSRDSILSRVFVDDRAFVSPRVWALMDRFHAWCAWSFSVGLLENQQKTVVVASTPARRATLRKHWPDYVASNTELLGSCSMVACRGLMPKELERVNACKRVLTLLACIGMPFEPYMRACRSFAVSKVAYGWIARAPPLTLCKALFSCVHMGSRRLRSASVWLRAALFGGGLHLDVLFATQLVGILSRVQRRRALTWSSVSGTPARALKDWLCSDGSVTLTGNGVMLCRVLFLILLSLIMPVLVNMWSVLLGALGVSTNIVNPLGGTIILIALKTVCFTELIGMVFGSLRLLGRRRVLWRQGVLFLLLRCTVPKILMLLTLVFGLVVMTLAVLTILLGLVLVVHATWISRPSRVSFLWLGLGGSFLVWMLTWIVFMLGLFLCSEPFGNFGMALNVLC